MNLENNNPATKNTGRLDWFDIAKGIAMLCIIAGHMGISIVNRMVFTFHVPIFFLISGYFISQRLSYKEYLAKRAKGLILPYIYTSFLLIIAKIALDLVKGKSDCILYDVKTVFIQALYGSGTNSNKTPMEIKQIGAIWFLLALFWALAFVRLFINMKCGWLWVIVIAIVSYVSSRYIWLPWDIQAGGTAAVFVYIGAFYKKKYKKLDFKWWIVVAGALALVLEFAFDIRLSVVSNTYKYTIVSVIGAVLISYFVLWISKLLDSTKNIKTCLCYVGTNSVIFLCYHLVELNNAPWNILYSALGGLPSIVQHMVCFACKLIFITICTELTLRIKCLRSIFSK